VLAIEILVPMYGLGNGQIYGGGVTVLLDGKQGVVGL